MKPDSRNFRMCACVGLLALMLASAVRGDEPATRPAGGRPFLTGLVQRIRDAVAKLDLTDEQKTKVASILDDAAQQAQSLADQLQSLPPGQRYQKAGPFLRKLREDLSQALGTDQFKTLGQSIPALREQGPDGPTTRGEGTAPAGMGLRFEALKAALAKLELSDDQKQRIADLLGDMQSKAQEIRQSAADGGDVQPKLQQLRQELRSKLLDILTPDQAQQLRDAMQQGGAGGRPQTSESQKPSASATDPPPEQSKPTLPEPGSDAPDFKAVMLGGNVMHLSAWKGHVVVIEFGSLSCPVFRDHAAQMEKLRSDVGMRASFLLVYTREAFPTGPENIQRNADEGISIPQGTDLTQRKAAAEHARQLLRITLPMAVDTMADEIAGAYGGMPNGAVVIGKDGKIVAREQWTNPDSLRRAIDQANSH
jgi:Spy/CpxP family protein refolding chaperone